MNDTIVLRIVNTIMWGDHCCCIFSCFLLSRQAFGCGLDVAEKVSVIVVIAITNSRRPRPKPNAKHFRRYNVIGDSFIIIRCVCLCLCCLYSITFYDRNILQWLDFRYSFKWNQRWLHFIVTFIWCVNWPYPYQYCAHMFCVLFCFICMAVSVDIRNWHRKVHCIAIFFVTMSHTHSFSYCLSVSGSVRMCTE